MLAFPLARWIRWNRRGILEIHLDFFERFAGIQRLRLAAMLSLDAIVGPQNLPDRACGARQVRSLGKALGMAGQVVEQRFGSWYPVQVLWRLVSQVEDTLHHERIRRRRRRMAGTRLSKHDLSIFWGRFSKALAPLLRPASRAFEIGCQFCYGPGWMQYE